MHLLHVQELKVEEFNDDQKRPPYAILSHTWENGEVSFQDIQTPEAVSMAGYAKILKCCEIAKQDGFEYVWIDTCCINKTSSSELSEAINSMYKWYRFASVCYVFLSDVESEVNHQDSESQFRRSRWFTRGWTLQELLAPEVLGFYDHNWVDIGTKHTLQKTISEITKIPRAALINADSIKHFSIAVRMSWASRRETTRVEDRGYSLMGIFDVNMPPLYGEGRNAFKRLQLEIIKDSQDESIFAWSILPQERWDPKRSFSHPDRERLLASTPRYFGECQGVIYNDQYQSTPPFSMSNRGLHIWLPVIHYKNKFEADEHLAVLNCVLADGGRIGILLALESESGRYVRSSKSAHVIKKDDFNTMEKPMELYITAQETGPNPLLSRYQIGSRSTFHFLENTSPETGYHLQYFFDGSKRSGLDGTPSRTCIFNEAQHQKKDLYTMYLVVQSIQDPSIQAVIVLGNDQASEKVNHYCRVFMGSIIPSTLTKINNSVSLEEKRSHFSKIFPGDEFQYFPNNNITRHLIAITVRTGPATGMDNPWTIYESGDHNYRVYITFCLPLLRDKELSEGDIV